jgi:hypothetical protein
MAPPHPSLLLLVMLGACTSPQLLADTPISGGSDEVRAAIQAELAAFDEATGFGRTHVSKVRVKDLGPRLGRFERLSRTVLLEDDLDEDRVIEVLRHELCHALNTREELHQDEPDLYKRLAEGVFGSDFVGDASSCRSTACQQDEVFAAYCATGPWVARASSAECSGDPADGTAALQQLADALWLGADQPLPSTAAPAWASVQLEEPSDSIRAWGTTSPDVIDLSIETSEGFVGGLTDIHTGEPAWGADVWVPPPPDGPPAGLPMELTSFGILERSERTRGPVGRATGPYAAMVRMQLFDQGEVLRHVWSDGERWWLVGDGCTDRQVEPFIAGDTVFTLRPDDTHIGWGPVQP